MTANQYTTAASYATDICPLVNVLDDSDATSVHA